MPTSPSLTIHVTEENIRSGIVRNCFNCAVSLALQEGTQDDEAHVIEVDDILRIVVWSRYLAAPDRVRNFVWEYDSLSKNEYDCSILPRKLTGDLAPFDFELPPMSDPEWEEICSGCEHLFASGELDEEGYCENCRDDAKDEADGEAEG